MLSRWKFGGIGKCWSGIVVGRVGWGTLLQTIMGFLFYYRLVGVFEFDAHGELLVMPLSLTIHCYISHAVLPW